MFGKIKKLSRFSAKTRKIMPLKVYFCSIKYGLKVSFVLSNNLIDN